MRKGAAFRVHLRQRNVLAYSIGRIEMNAEDTANEGPESDFPRSGTATW